MRQSKTTAVLCLLREARRNRRATKASMANVARCCRALGMDDAGLMAVAMLFSLGEAKATPVRRRRKRKASAT